MAGLFIGLNPVVIVRQSGGRRVTVHRSRERVVYNGPLVIMLNRYSASASEILAGAMHDYQRALLVGDTTTFGKGTVQNIFQLPEGYGALKVTIAQFYRVSGWSTQNRGVESSIVIPSLNNVREIGESTLGGRDIWLDENIGRLNTDKQGRYLGSFSTDDSILVIYNDGEYELTSFELTNRYKIITIN